MSADIFSISVYKGGVAKTTTTAILAQAAAYKGARALVIDLDAQANASLFLSAKIGGPGSYGLLTGTPAADLIQHTPAGVDVIPASQNLTAITSERGSARRLRQAIAPILADYDYIFIDTHGTGGELLYNALMAATGLIMPIEQDIYNLQALYQTMETARQIQRSNPALSITGFLFTKCRHNTRIGRQIRETIIEAANKKNIPYLGAVRLGVAVDEAAARRESIYHYAPNSNPARDYLSIFETLQQAHEKREEQ